MPPTRIGVIGAGYVGLTTAACLAGFGNEVVCADIDETTVARLRRGRVPLNEPGLAELVIDGQRAGRLAFVTDTAAAAGGAEVVFVCVPTPCGPDGAADLTAVHSVLRRSATLLPSGSVLVLKSTVPPGTTDLVRDLLDRSDVAVVNNPEFLREGQAVEDFLHPDRVVIGARAEEPAGRVAALYRTCAAPVVVTDPVSAEMVKYASNCFLATRLSYVNALAEVCERVGADIDAVTSGMRLDPRIGGAFLRPGPGWGGSCLPKDASALLAVAESAGVEFDLLRAAIETNARVPRRIVAKVRTAITGSARGSLAGIRIGLLGLTFKAGTDDLRDSPALAVAALLAEAGAELSGHDPRVAPGEPGVAPVWTAEDPYLAAKDASALILLTEWPEFTELDWERLAGEVRHRIVVDTRNHLPRESVRAAGFRYHGIGRPE
jgi:UDPglucose 6-dehydrogenase